METFTHTEGVQNEIFPQGREGSDTDVEMDVEGKATLWQLVRRLLDDDESVTIKERQNFETNGVMFPSRSLNVFDMDILWFEFRTIRFTYI